MPKADVVARLKSEGFKPLPGDAAYERGTRTEDEYYDELDHHLLRPYLLDKSRLEVSKAAAPPGTVDEREAKDAFEHDLQDQLDHYLAGIRRFGWTAK